MPRALLSEEAEQEEHDDREKLRDVRDKLRALLDRRQVQFEEVRRLSDEQKRLYDARQPGEREVERIHQEYRDIGHAMAEGRHLRDEARAKVDAALIAVREFRASIPRGEPPRPEAIRREIAELEHAQQTRTMTLAEENALIKRLRQLVKVAEEAQKNRILPRRSTQAFGGARDRGDGARGSNSADPGGARAAQAGTGLPDAIDPRPARGRRQARGRHPGQGARP